ncbi:hypothetical protein CDV31_005026 [Fusarium ambrosium]|uniref:Uncharacterized protein n=1 Tax=Fusarium ambrosium TaxID=131363 RepID=A0A428UMI0_9HYPO|nr:hypothetical protein CDV31_005026 [Fusarium ambrosium]
MPYQQDREYARPSSYGQGAPPSDPARYDEYPALSTEMEVDQREPAYEQSYMPEPEAKLQRSHSKRSGSQPSASRARTSSSPGRSGEKHGQKSRSRSYRADALGEKDHHIRELQQQLTSQVEQQKGLHSTLDQKDRELSKCNEELIRIAGELNQKKEELAVHTSQWAEALDQKDRELSECNKELRQTEGELNQKKEELLMRNRMWKKTAGELNKLRASTQSFYQITDEYLVGLFMSLRSSIRDFSIQYFGNNLYKGTLSTKEPHYLAHLEATLPSGKVGIKSALASERSYQVIQALIWRVLVAEVFNRFTWVSGKTADSFIHLRTKLEPARNHDSHGMKMSEPEAERKFQTWSATTIGLLLDAQGPEEQSHIREELDQEGAEIVSRLVNTIRDMTEAAEQDLRDQLSCIIDEAFTVGKEISRQISRITWTLDFGSGHDTLAFDPETMGLEKGDRMGKPRVVNWIVAPGVIKRGKSTGEGFNHEQMLLKRIVSCDE